MTDSKKTNSKDINTVLTQLVQETRAPMKSVIDFLSILSNEDISDKNKNYIDSISNNINLIRNIIHDILVDNGYQGNMSDVYDIYKPIFADESISYDDVSKKAVDEYITDVNVIRDIFAKLEPLLINHDLSSFDMIDDLRKIQGTEEIAELIEQIDFEEAIRAFKRFKTENLFT